MSYAERTTFTPTAASQDAFGRLRTSEQYTIFDSKLLIDTASLFWDYTGSSAISSSVTYNQSKAAAFLQVTGSNFMYRQTKMRFNYQPGKSQLILMTGDLTPQPGIIKRVGYYEAINGTGEPLNGVYFERSGSDLYCCIAQSGSIETRVSQSQWNIDTLTAGSTLNPSGYTHDPSKVQIFAFDFEWLGVGNIRFANVIDGKIIPVYQHSHANTDTGITFANPNLPCRYAIKSSLSTASGSMQTICSAVQTEGGFQYNGVQRALSTPVAGITLSTTSPNPYIIMRQKAGQNMSTIALQRLHAVMVQSAGSQADLTKFSVILNPTFTVTPNWTSSLNSTIEYNLGTTGGTVSGGTTLREYLCGGGTSAIDVLMSDTPLRLGATIGGVSDIMCIAGLGNNARLAAVAINYTEIL